MATMVQRKGLKAQLGSRPKKTKKPNDVEWGGENPGRRGSTELLFQTH